MTKKLAVFLFMATVFAAACNKPQEAQQPIVEEAEVTVEETFVPETNQEAKEAGLQEENTLAENTEKAGNINDIQALFAECNTDEDCVAVYPSCCKEAFAPFFINKQYESEFIQEFKRLSNEPTPCQQCPDTNFSGSKSVCLSGKCVEAIMDYK